MSSEQRDPIYGEYEVMEDDKQDAWRRATLFEEPMIRYKKYNQILPKAFLEISEKIRHFETREDDVWIASQIKSGSTWMGELTWCLLNNLDYETAHKENLDVRMTYLEINSVILKCQKSLIPTDVIGIADGNKSPRLIKTHLSFDMLPQKILQNKNKMIYMLRNPRDVCISMYNHHRIFDNYQGTLEEHLDQFLSGNCGYYTPHDVNIIGYHLKRDLPHILFITYEEMKKDFRNCN
ncbi:unnamed protein product [Lepeophtheirus salmonis]|uniref:(salmon louse) hypothetical protein n=1 Tax=Lepeophtheirus salmonis TaxID=72036 RepID=A0A7R8CF59_LEPSM|nr:unnamed protein product [Lepeophtheirus salmonis]CAF2803468.1 unnamed protein product [Lepeophtheirus salmonis]